MSTNKPSQAITQVPCNIITGFLGVGKTSAILNLLKHKPEHERWAVLVNEFGEIGIDGSLFSGQHRQEQGVFIKEVPGGCMCCAAGLPMQIALNQLLSRARPDRLLIEPTGLGHPLEVLEVLQSQYYTEVLHLQASICLVDARKLGEPRYLEHPSFVQQLAIADVVVGNKADLYHDTDRAAFADYLDRYKPTLKARVFCEYGNFDPDLLAMPRSEYDSVQGSSNAPKSEHKHEHEHTQRTVLASDKALPQAGYLSARNTGEGFQSQGWRFGPEITFSRQKLLVLFGGLVIERLKAVLITDDGIYGYNLSGDALSEVALDECYESRIEAIFQSEIFDLQAQLLECVI